MTNLARNNIFSTLREGRPSPEIAISSYAILKEKQWRFEDRIQHYRDMSEAVNTQVFEVQKDTWLADVKSFLEKRGIKQLMFGLSTDICDDLKEGLSDCSTQLVPYDSNVEACKETLFTVEAGITTSLGAIADTGSLIILPTKEEPRLLSLTPPIHIAIVKADRFFNTFYEAIETEDCANHMPTNLLLVSGPSKTADIEQELCYGVHGPKELIVFIVH